jgi:hypothetical protein
MLEDFQGVSHEISEVLSKKVIASFGMSEVLLDLGAVACSNHALV